MRVVGDGFQRVAQFGDAPEPPGRHPITRGTAIGRAILDRRTIHVNDLLAQIDTEYPDARQLQQKTSVRTVLATPLLREDSFNRAILVLRREVRSFSDKRSNCLENIKLIEQVRFKGITGAQRRIARGAGASDGNFRGARHHQPLAH